MALPAIPTAIDRAAVKQPDEAAVIHAQALWDDVSQDVQTSLGKMATALTDRLKARLKEMGQAAQQEEKERFRQRLQEVEQSLPGLAGSA